MTRINSAINPTNLTDQHLVAELRELPRIFTAVNKRLEQGKSFDDIPCEFTLGKGHVKFFYNRLFYLLRRHEDLRQEYRNRYENDWFYNCDCKLNRDHPLYRYHTSTKKEKQLLIERISTRIMESNQVPRYYRKEISKEQAIKILKS